MTKQEIIEMIHRAGFEAVERDTLYNPVERADGSEPGAIATGFLRYKIKLCGTTQTSH